MRAQQPETGALETPAVTDMLRLEDMKVHFTASRAFGKAQTIHAVDGVSLSVSENDALGIIGESGCGKSTTGRAIVHLNEPTAGKIFFRGTDITHPGRAQRRALRETIQFVFQDPQSSLNPRMTVEALIAEPLRAYRRWNGKTGPETVATLLDRVGLTRDAAHRYPHEFSGGQRQRIGIARALALDPELLVLDEPVSALDVSVQAQVLNLLMDLRRTSALAYIMISHDLDVIRHVTDHIVVMYLGVIVESGPTADVLGTPAHPYTVALVSATPPSSPDETRERIVLRGELPSPVNPPSGCRFRTRCWKADAVCETTVPPPTPFPGTGRMIACHHPLAIDAPLTRKDLVP
jgi:oligopeptide/dipeptide ABC transporter ATP-binding protein